MNFEKFTGKHMRLSLAFNEAADLQSLTLAKKKKSDTVVFLCILRNFSNTIFKEPKKLSISDEKCHYRCSTRF